MSRLKSDETRDVVIIGAGPAGSSLAAGLAGLGWDVLLVERQRLPHHKVCGEFLSPESQASLETMGLSQVVKDLAPTAMAEATLVSRSGFAVRMALPGHAWGISRFALDAALAGAAAQAGAEIRSGTTATGIERAAPTWQISLRAGADSNSLRARTVIAACGRYSLPGLPPSNRQKPGNSYVGVKRHYENVTMPARVELFLFPGGYAGVAPIEAGRVNVCLLATRSAFNRGGRQVSSMLEAAAAWNPVLGRRLAGGKALAETEAAVAPVDPYRPAAPWDGGIACVGDAAVMIPPLSGDGMAMALRSAELCAPLAHDFLRGRLSLAEWEARYWQVWRREFDRRIRLSRYLQTILALPFLSDALVGLGRLAPSLADLMVRATRGQPEAAPVTAPNPE